MVVGRDGYVVRDDLGDGGPVFEGPLGVEGALGPGKDSGFLAGHCVEQSDQ